MGKYLRFINLLKQRGVRVETVPKIEYDKVVEKVSKAVAALQQCPCGATQEDMDEALHILLDLEQEKAK